MASFKTGTHTELLSNLTPDYWPNSGSTPPSDRVGTHIVFFCPLCGPGVPRLQVPIANPVDGKAPVAGAVHHLMGEIRNIGGISLSEKVNCPSGGHKLLVQRGIVRLPGLNE